MLEKHDRTIQFGIFDSPISMVKVFQLCGVSGELLTGEIVLARHGVQVDGPSNPAPLTGTCHL
jgi:hypothetical protein